MVVTRMFVYFLVLLMLILTIEFITIFVVDINFSKSLTVLVYHHIEELVNSDVSCTPLQFEEHMKALLSEKVRFVNLNDLYKIIIGGINSFTDKENLVMVTFDDGYESLYHYALPIAKKYQIPMVVFMITSRLGLKPQNVRYLSEEQIKEMIGSGLFEFCSHTHNFHTNILVMYNSFNPQLINSFEQVIEYDLMISKKILQNLTDKLCFAIAWPYGKFNRQIQKIALNCGYKVQFTSLFGKNYNIIDPISIKRIPVSKRDKAIHIVKKIQKNFLFR